MDKAQKYEKGVTGVFWDAEECKIPCGLNALSVSKNIRCALKNASFRGVTSIFAYGSTEDIMAGFDSSAGKLVHRTPQASDYRGAGDIYENESPESAGDELKVLDQNESPEIPDTADIVSRDEGAKHLPAIVINPTKPGDKSERYGAFIRGVFSWALDNYPPANMILILGDVAEHKWRLIGAFHHLRDAGYNVAFVQPQTEASMQLIRIGKRNWPWERLSLGQGPIPIPRPNPETSSPNFGLLCGIGALACVVIVMMTYRGAKMATR